MRRESGEEEKVCAAEVRTCGQETGTEEAGEAGRQIETAEGGKEGGEEAGEEADEEACQEARDPAREDHTPQGAGRDDARSQSATEDRRR